MTGGGEPEVSAWWRGELSRTGQLAYRFRDSGASCQLVIRSARSQRVEPPCGIGWFAVGDAAMAFDPMSSQGIAKALDHGKRAPPDIASHPPPDPSPMPSFA